MKNYTDRAFNPQPEPPGVRYGFDPQPEPPRPNPNSFIAFPTPVSPVGLLLPAVQA